jgi:hypothetical protein
MLNLAAFSESSDSGFVQIFNGKDLTDWSGLPDAWSVVDGSIVAESTPAKPCKVPHYLFWTKKMPDNFHLKATLRLTGKGNSGIQFRSEKRPNWDAYGYQADLDNESQFTGCLYHHKRFLIVERGIDRKIEPNGKTQDKKFADSKELIKSYKPNDWNEYEIIADGSVITLIINGKMMCRVDDQHATESAKSGIIALQMHPGPPMKIEFKKIQLKSLEKK